VEPDSAVLGISSGKEQKLGCAADHSSICKFKDPYGEDFIPVLKSIKALAEDAIKASDQADRQKIEQLSKPLTVLTLNDKSSDCTYIVRAAVFESEF
jgi:hypothetical protein